MAGGAKQNMESLDIIKGLLKALQVAHSDRNMILFERLKTVISMMSRGGSTTNVAFQNEGCEHDGEDAEEEGIKENKIVMTELMGQLLKQGKDQQMLKAYQECFLLLTKTYH